MFDFLKIYLFSEVNGVVLLNGKPVQGAELIRTAAPGSKSYTDKAMTDAEGRFHFDAMVVHTLRTLIPGEAVIRQTISIRFQGKDYLGWKSTKRDIANHGELNLLDPRKSLPIQLFRVECELTNEDDIPIAAGNSGNAYLGV